MYSELQIGIPTHKNGSELFHSLYLRFRHEPGVKHRSDELGRTKVYTIRCPSCSMMYIIGGEESPQTILSAAIEDKSSIITKHSAITGHPPPKGQQPIQLKTLGHNDIPSDQRVVLLKLIYEELGYECSTNEKLQLIPPLVAQGVKRAISLMNKSK